eukprot:15185874-Heterocapsa_arctica.AAC.1
MGRHWGALKRLLRYLRGTKTMELGLEVDDEMDENIERRELGDGWKVANLRPAAPCGCEDSCWAIGVGLSRRSRCRRARLNWYR